MRSCQILLKRHPSLVNQPLFGDLRDYPSKVRNNCQDVCRDNSNSLKRRNFTTKADSAEVKHSFMSLLIAKNLIMNYIIAYLLRNSLDKRAQFIKTSGLCFACLKVGHTSRDCNQRLICKNHNRKHPTVLHDDESDDRKIRDKQASMLDSASENDMPSSKLTVCSTKLKPARTETGADGSHKVSCSVVPVMVRIKGRTELVKTCAALDGCSTSCFINSNLLSQLDVRSEPHTLTTRQNDRGSV